MVLYPFSFLPSTSKVPDLLNDHVVTWISLMNYWKTNQPFMVGSQHSFTALGRVMGWEKAAHGLVSSSCT